MSPKKFLTFSMVLRPLPSPGLRDTVSLAWNSLAWNSRLLLRPWAWAAPEGRETDCSPKRSGMRCHFQLWASGSEKGETEALRGSLASCGDPVNAVSARVRSTHIPFGDSCSVRSLSRAQDVDIRRLPGLACRRGSAVVREMNQHVWCWGWGLAPRALCKSGPSVQPTRWVWETHPLPRTASQLTFYGHTCHFGTCGSSGARRKVDVWCLSGDMAGGGPWTSPGCKGVSPPPASPQPSSLSLHAPFPALSPPSAHADEDSSCSAGGPPAAAPCFRLPVSLVTCVCLLSPSQALPARLPACFFSTEEAPSRCLETGLGPRAPGTPALSPAHSGLCSGGRARAARLPLARPPPLHAHLHSRCSRASSERLLRVRSLQVLMSQQDLEPRHDSRKFERPLGVRHCPGPKGRSPWFSGCSPESSSQPTLPLKDGGSAAQSGEGGGDMSGDTQQRHTPRPLDGATVRPATCQDSWARGGTEDDNVTS